MSKQGVRKMSRALVYAFVRLGRFSEMNSRPVMLHWRKWCYTHTEQLLIKLILVKNSTMFALLLSAVFTRDVTGFQSWVTDVTNDKTNITAFLFAEWAELMVILLLHVRGIGKRGRGGGRSSEYGRPFIEILLKFHIRKKTCSKEVFLVRRFLI